ncbi:MAG: heparinase II/III family protein [Wenyingzhuangia sp.]|uniref:alginate lyase family protein n=1 Tax=Wenyingzhuangia sp. TaxID=1964193 RepID=UPI00321ABED4
MKLNFYCIIKATFLILSVSFQVNAQEHPSLVLTRSGVENIRKELGRVPLFDETLKRVKEEVDLEMASGIDTPIPKDYSGGYTHARHKKNFLILPKAAVLYQILQDEKYADYVKDMLMQYEAMYKTLPVHPKTRSYARGKLFWQCLNDSNWLVYMSQAYDCIYDYLSEKERNRLENNLFRPFADFISIGNPQFYNRVHNHSTWGNAAVGMIALVMGDDVLLERALYGIKDDGLDANAKDDDGGFIKNKDGKAGFLANLEEPFSPDGYYTEGPYYQRYAMYPFLIFAEALENVKPDLKIFNYKNGVLLKSVNALLNLTDADGEFFALNDGQKGMSYYTEAVVSAVDIAFCFGNQDKSLLSIAERQNKVLLDDSGLMVALAIREGEALPFHKKSVNLSDGSEGDEGGVCVLRTDQAGLELVFKYTAQGSSHGHYDKLSYSLFDNGEEVIQDYGLARFVNIEQKGGGNYLKENKTWAKQTIAHNTIVRDEISHFKGKYEEGSKHHSELSFYDLSNQKIQIISAKENHAYPDTNLHRTMMMIEESSLGSSYVVDLMRVVSKDIHQYDFPFYFKGQVIQTNFEYTSNQTLAPLGSKHGYQHLWVEGIGKPLADNTKFSFLNKGVYYTITTTADMNDKLFFTRIGANDPKFNLRRDAGFMIRRNKSNTVFASVLESHGGYDYVSESSEDARSHIETIKVVYDDQDYTAFTIKTTNNVSKVIIIANKQVDTSRKHKLRIDGRQYEWNGPYLVH